MHCLRLVMPLYMPEASSHAPPTICPLTSKRRYGTDVLTALVGFEVCRELPSVPEDAPVLKRLPTVGPKTSIRPPFLTGARPPALQLPIASAEGGTSSPVTPGWPNAAASRQLHISVSRRQIGGTVSAFGALSPRVGVASPRLLSHAAAAQHRRAMQYASEPGLWQGAAARGGADGVGAASAAGGGEGQWGAAVNKAARLVGGANAVNSSPSNI